MFVWFPSARKGMHVVKLRSNKILHKSVLHDGHKTVLVVVVLVAVLCYTVSELSILHKNKANHYSDIFVACVIWWCQVL